MKEAVCVLVSFVLTVAVSDPSNPIPWKAPNGWTQTSRVQAHSGLTVINPPNFPQNHRSLRRGGPLPGYLPLRPVSAPRHPRWFGSETAPKATYLRPPSNYERYPPFWMNEQHSAQRSRHLPHSHHRTPKKDCNPCNTVPWTPIFKSFAGLSSNHHPRELVPQIDVFPESSIHQTSVLTPLVTADLTPPLVDPAQDLSSLPVGNLPVSPDLLLHPQQQIPFPELSHLPVAPVHTHVPFRDSPDLVPPLKSSNVVVTISEHDPHDVHIVPHDQHSDSSSLIDNRDPYHYHRYQRPSNGGVDIIKSVPLAEYTSSIEYPINVVQSSFIDIQSTPAPNNQQQSQQHRIHGKHQLGGYNKVSDFILNIGKDGGLKAIPDSHSEGSQKSENVEVNQTQQEVKQPVAKRPQQQQSNGNHMHLQQNQVPVVHQQQNQVPIPHQNNQVPVVHQQQNQVPIPHQNNQVLPVHQQNQVQLAQQQQNQVQLAQQQQNQLHILHQQNQQMLQQQAEQQFNYNIQQDKNGKNFRDVLDPNILTPPPLPPHLTQLLPTLDTAFLHPLFPVEPPNIASNVNGALLPPPIAQPMNPTSVQPPNVTLPPKKIQIIIPYTTINAQDVLDQNAVGSKIESVNQSLPASQKAQPIVVTEAPRNKARKVPANLDLTSISENGWTGFSSDSNQVQHILASNIRDLLQKEMMPKHEQNIRLQKNIDNWTALEYSNHKIVGKKNPTDVVTHAQAVTSIPGTSISHLLLPSKKIPTGYFTTTMTPEFDEPTSTPFVGADITVNSKPFTTITRYSTVTRSGSSTRSTKTYRRSTTSTTPRSDFENEIPEETTPGIDWSSLKVTIAPGTNEKVYVVTPVNSLAATNGKRSTRHIDVTEKYQPEESRNAISTVPFDTTKTTTAKTVEKNTETFTKLEKVTSHEDNQQDKLKSKSKNYLKSTQLFRVKANQTRIDKLSKFNKPKPIEKFFATTTKPLTTTTTKSYSSTVSSTSRSSSSTEDSQASTVALFPFRNGGELPLEMAQANFSASELVFKNTGERKTLIRQVKVNNRRGKGQTKSTVSGKDSLDGTTEKDNRSSWTAEAPPSYEVDVVLPQNAVKKGESKKATNVEKKKSEKPSVIKQDEPNITEDDREDINLLSKNANETETLLAVESSMPGGVFGSTSRDNSSRSLLDTIKLLRDFLAETSEEESESQEKNHKIGKVLEKIDQRTSPTEKEEETYKYNFPEYLVGELNLDKDEMSLVEGAMVELRKKKKLETSSR